MAKRILKSESKRKYDSEDSRRRLLRAAIDVFSSAGYDAATTRKIAKKAGVNESLIHRYFKNKQGLFLAIVTEFHRLSVLDAEYPSGQTVEEEIHQFMQFRLNFSRKHKKFLRLGITRAIIDPKIREQWVTLAKNGTPKLVSRLETLQREGKMKREVNLEQLSLLITSITFSMSMFTEVIFNFEKEMAEQVLLLGTRLISESLAKEN